MPTLPPLAHLTYLLPYFSQSYIYNTQKAWLVLKKKRVGVQKELWRAGATEPERDVTKEPNIVMSKSATTATGNTPTGATGHDGAPSVVWSFPVLFGRIRILEEQATEKEEENGLLRQRMAGLQEVRDLLSS